MSVEDLSNSSSNRHKSIKLVWWHEDGETQEEVENKEEELKRGDLGLWTNWSGVNPSRACD